MLSSRRARKAAWIATALLIASCEDASAPSVGTEAPDDGPGVYRHTLTEEDRYPAALLPAAVLGVDGGCLVLSSESGDYLPLLPPDAVVGTDSGGGPAVFVGDTILVGSESRLSVAGGEIPRSHAEGLTGSAFDGDCPSLPIWLVAPR